MWSWQNKIRRIKILFPAVVKEGVNTLLSFMEPLSIHWVLRPGQTGHERKMKKDKNLESTTSVGLPGLSFSLRFLSYEVKSCTFQDRVEVKEIYKQTYSKKKKSKEYIFQRQSQPRLEVRK